jgi:hypothetical protein
MIGWWIVIAQLTPKGGDRKAAVLATWETSVSGIDWLNKLSKEGLADQLSRDGYPNRFTAIARDVLPLIAGGPPAHNGPEIIGDDYVMPGNWTGKVTLHHDKIAACPPDQMLTIEAWDQS